MPHPRKRLIFERIEKEAKFWPVISLVGARQVGKTTLLRNLSRWTYLSFDQLAVAEAARADPASLLKYKTIIDEAQKVPVIFDEIKNEVDSHRKPGSFILSGSVRFSKRTFIRESLTGRTLTLEMHPLSLLEALGKNFNDAKTQTVTRTEFTKHLNKGGMPGIFSVHDQKKVTSYWKALIESYLYRDLVLVIEKNPKPKTAESILRAVCHILSLGETPTFSRILKKTGGTRSVIQRHLAALEDMMILQSLPHFKKSDAKTAYLPFDNGLFLTVLDQGSEQKDQAVLKACLWINMLNELKVFQNEILGYAESNQGELIHAIYKRNSKNALHAIQLSTEVTPHGYSLRLIKAFAEKNKAVVCVLSPAKLKMKILGAPVLPWESIFEWV